MKRPAPLLTALLALALLAGCGGSGGGGSNATTGTEPPAQTSTAPAGATARECKGSAGAALRLRATGISCAQGLALVKEWKGQEGCAPATGASRSGCKIGGSYRCLSVASERGLTVSCARPGSSVAFTVRRD